MSGSITHLIINSPFVEPSSHWTQDEGGNFIQAEGRRNAGYMLVDPTAKSGGEFIELKTVNEIRKRVAEWRDEGYGGATIVSKKLLEHWRDSEQRDLQFYFAQIEAIETLIWWIEANESYKQGIKLEGDGGAWERVCSKMATGTGKTTVMAMIIAWQALNAASYPKDSRFSATIFIVTPGLTVKERLSVLYPSHPQNYYDSFNMLPESLREKLRVVKLKIENWHCLMPLKESQSSVVKKGKESDEAFCRRVLGEMANEKNIVIINDEAHHAYRIPAELKNKKIEGLSKEEQEEATRWIEGLDRIHKKRNITRCFDLSATPFAPTGKKTKGEALFGWIVSDFGLNDAIESGLVKTPRVVVRDDALPDTKTYKSKLYHIFNDDSVKDDLNRKAEPHEALPQLVQAAYNILAADWQATFDAWKDAGHKAPPVMLTVCNRTETAARVEEFFIKGDILFQALADKSKTLRVDSKVLEAGEKGDTKSGDKEYELRLKEIVSNAGLDKKEKERLEAFKKEELLREIVDTVGKSGKAGENIQKVISVAMLSEGWDAKTVTHIMGLRAFSSQLLCEQVIGRGLRRTSYETDHETGFFTPEYVNVFGVPFSFLPHEGDGGTPPPTKPKTAISVLADRAEYEIKWPNILRIDKVMKPTLDVDFDTLEKLEIKPEETPMSAQLAPIVNGQADVGKYTTIELEKCEEQFRYQRIIFQSARRVFESLKSESFKGDEGYLIFQIIRLVEKFVAGDKIVIPSLFYSDDLRRRVLLALNMDKIVEHLARYIKLQNTESLEPIFDQDYPIRSTGDMREWYSSKPCEKTRKSQISHVVFDSGWESAEAYAIETNENVEAYAKNDHLGFEILYTYGGVVRKFRPDFLIRLKNGTNLILEVKGQDSQQNKAKREYAKEWCEAVNSKGGFGRWEFAVSFSVNDIRDILKLYNGTTKL